MKQTKITPETRLRVRLLFDQGITKAEIARLTAVSPKMVTYILHPEKALEDRKKQAEKPETAYKALLRQRKLRERRKEASR